MSLAVKKEEITLQVTKKRILFAEGLTVLSIKPSCLPTVFAPALPSVQTFGKISHRRQYEKPPMGDGHRGFGGDGMVP